MTVPTLETDRLVLRPHWISDHDAACAMWADPLVTRFIGGKPSTKPQTWARILTYAGHWALMGYGYWAIVERESGRFIGEAGFADFRRDADPSLAGVPELGWTIATEAAGRGFATEAVRAAQRWGDVHLRAARTVCIIAEGNAASVRVAEKCGFERYGAIDFNGARVQLFERGTRG